MLINCLAMPVYVLKWFDDSCPAVARGLSSYIANTASRLVAEVDDFSCMVLVSNIFA